MRTLMIMAGGTGGHVYPALAVARQLQEQGFGIVWLGTRRGIEARAVPAAGFDIEWIRIRGLRGKGLLGWLLAPLRGLYALGQAVAAILRRRPDALLGMGGFVAGPGGLAAWLLRRPLLIHEANAVAGLTNRMLARLAQRVMCGFPGTRGIDPRQAEVTGNPVRVEIATLPGPDERGVAQGQRPLRLLVVGGSLGARVFNETVPVALAQIDAGSRPEVRHQCGQGNGSATAAAYAAAAIDCATVTEFVDDMAAAYGWADLVLCRAGAMTVAELAAAGVAAILVPFPYAVGDHQCINAGFLSERDAAVLLPQERFSADNLAKLLQAFHDQRDRLLALARNARALARPDATAAVTRVCMEALRA